ncbi:MAG: 16S rRNA (cytosine(967)-C(5))-methyltransferase RsmB [Candidatus Eisenbacteria bacterium]
MSAPPRRTPPRRRKTPPRELALQILHDAESRSAYADRLLETRLRANALEPRDAAFVTTLVQGTLRYRALLDHHLDALLGARPDGMAGLPLWIRGALRLGAYQMLVLTRVPVSAAVAESVELAKQYGHPGTAGLVNAVLRRLASGERAALPAREADPVAHLAVATSHPRWLVERWVARLGVEEAERLLHADNEEPAITVRPNLHRLRMAVFQEALRAEGHDSVPGPNGGPVRVVAAGYVPSRSQLFRQGMLWLQDEAESVVPLLLGAKSGMRVLDYCAAPGGKAAALAEAVAPGGLIVAMERHASRARSMHENLSERLRMPRIAVVCADGTAPPFTAPFEAVLVDAPCSGLGVLRRRADARWRKEAPIIAEMAALQRALLHAAAALVKKGGVMVYSVCSLEPEETDATVKEFLDTHPSFVQEDARPHVPPGFRGADAALRAYPHTHGTDGVYAVRLRRS